MTDERYVFWNWADAALMASLAPGCATALSKIAVMLAWNL